MSIKRIININYNDKIINNKDKNKMKINSI